ncbi:hypothetical protein BDV23DRAFT_157405 [Aspergillus alliaceus]|uniref:Secreted protein n=1 Tax=Petromyces alliaceus TaxID=209559 RepID=A0A5N7C6K5_PETAA|nr:hypothetical protein BDV23DRAFT_157405 [Aspergillus alliaceus]
MHPNLFSVLSLSFLFPLSLDLHIVVTMVGSSGVLEASDLHPGSLVPYLRFLTFPPSIHARIPLPVVAHHRRHYGHLILSSYNR